MNLNIIGTKGFEALKSNRSFKDLKMFFLKFIKIILKTPINPYPYYELPPVLHIEPTNYCNLTCLCCPTQRGLRKKGYMNLNLFQKIIDGASKEGIKRIHLYLHGEPLLHPKFVELVSYIKSKNLGVDIVTNGMLFNKEKIEGIIHSGINNNDIVRFSILGYSKEIHEKLMKGVNHEKVLKNILDFLELRKKYKADGPIIETIFIITSENEHEKKKFLKYWRSKVDHVVVKHPSKSFSEYKKKENTTPIRKTTCYDLWDRMTIFWNGDVTICISDIDGDYILGNLKTQSIREIWNCKQLLSIKKLHEEEQFEKIPLCTKCDFYKK